MITLKNSLSGVSLWASGLGTESHIWSKGGRDIREQNSIKLKNNK